MTSIADMIPNWFEGGTVEEQLDEALAQIRILEQKLSAAPAAPVASFNEWAKGAHQHWGGINSRERALAHDAWIAATFALSATGFAPEWKLTSAKFEHPLAWGVTGKVYVACVGKDGQAYQLALDQP